MGAVGSIAVIGVLAAAVIGGIIFIPKLLSGIKLPNIFGGGSDIGNPLDDLLNFLRLESIRGPGDIEINFPQQTLEAFDFRSLIGRPGILGGEIFADAGGTRIIQSGQSAPGALIFGSDFASTERLADLLNRFRLTGRDVPGGRTLRINELIAARTVSQQARALEGLETTLTPSDRPASAGPVSNHPSTRRGPNVLGNFGAQGVQSRVANIFTGGLNNRGTAPRVRATRFVTGFTSRASATTRAFFSSGQAGARSARGGRI